MTQRMVAATTFAALAAFATALAPVAPAAAKTKASVGAAQLPAEMQNAGIHYTTGGVTTEEAAAFRREMHMYPLAIELVEKQKSGKHDEYTADATVRIADRAGRKIFDAQAKGPFMLVRLEPGTYELTAMLHDHKLHKKHVVVEHGKTARATFVFPAGTD